MGTAKRFEDLEIWKRARELTNRTYELSGRGEFRRDYGLRDQMRRAAVSVMSNIAEGFEGRTPAIFIEYLGHARGSAGELRSQTYIASDRKYMGEEDFLSMLEQTHTICKQTTRLIQYLESKPRPKPYRKPPSERQ
jgi:four helix bundle protein